MGSCFICEGSQFAYPYSNNIGVSGAIRKSDRARKVVNYKMDAGGGVGCAESGAAKTKRRGRKGKHLTDNDNDDRLYCNSVLQIRIRADPDSYRRTGSVFGIRIRSLQVKLSNKNPVFQQKVHHIKVICLIKYITFWVENKK
jgi:hypothetical protein